jgi:hypothetical protein
VPAVPTATVGTDTTQAASTAFVLAETALREPLSQSGAGVGQFTGISGATSGALSLPAGGQWSYNINRWNNGTQQSFATGIAAGGTVVGAATGGQYWNGWAKRIS